jgi:phosphopantetheine adenylyltransferase
LVYATVTLVYPLWQPTVITYPWNNFAAVDDSNIRRKEKQRTVVCIAGSFAPPHRGHAALIDFLATRYHTVYVVIGFNPNKQYAVSPAQRAYMVETMIHEHKDHWSNVHVRVVQGYIWRWAKPIGVHRFVRGIRTWEMDGAAERYLQFQNTWGPLVLGPLWWPLPTTFIEGHPKYRHVSSTLIRNLCASTSSTSQAKGPSPAIRTELQALVPDSIVDQVWNCYHDDGH